MAFHVLTLSKKEKDLMAAYLFNQIASKTMANEDQRPMGILAG